MKKNLPVTNREKVYGDDVTIISMTDLKGIITYVNQDFVEISGFSEDELVGQEKWPDLKQDGKYELPVRPDHEDAYELTLYVTCRDCKVTVTNVL